MRGVPLFLIVFSFLSISVESSPIGKYPFYFHAKKPHEMIHLHSGIASLQKRIDLIRKAKKRISLETFVYKKDLSSRILMSEFIKKAKAGVKVRIIVDKSITIIEMDEFYAEAVARYGIEIRHYNRAVDLSTAQFRTHRKILVIDGEEAIIGGRNIGNEYFGMDPKYNFYDRDIWLKGKAAKAIESSFDAYWNHKIVRKSKVIRSNSRNNRLFHGRRNRRNYSKLKERNHKKRRDEAFSWFNDEIQKESKVKKAMKRIEKLSRPLLNSYPKQVCPEVTFVSDLPGANLKKRAQRGYQNKFKILRKEFQRRLLDFNLKKVFFVSPYFLLNRSWRSWIDSMMGRGVEMSVLTNSLGSTDAFYVAAVFYHSILDFNDLGLYPYILNSRWVETPGVEAFTKDQKSQRWGIHSKVHIYNDDSFFVGSYNIDNRSDFYNAEMGIFCDGSRSLVNEIRKDVNYKLRNSYQITGKGTAVDQKGQKADYYGHATEKSVKQMKKYRIPSILLESLL